MQINIALAATAKDDAEKIRRRNFPTADARQIRDSYIYDRLCIANFDDTSEALLPYFEDDERSIKVQRMITIQSSSHEKLKQLASQLNRSAASTLRALIAYRLDHLENDTVVEIKPLESDVARLVAEKIDFLQIQLNTASKTLEEIRSLLGEEN